MIAIDTSALMAIALGEPQSEACMDVLEAEADLLISAGTVAEALIVAGRRNLSGEMNTLLERLGFTVVPVTAAVSRRIAEAYARWGRGVHPAGLNLGDCFAYALARENDCPLLYVGEDFARTDLPRASP
jgi:ribonuclease VapC